MNKHVVYVSDFSVGDDDSSKAAVPRSGYTNIGIELCRQIVNYKNEVKVLGLGYTGQEHQEPFSIVPCNTLQDVVNNCNVLKQIWRIDVIIVSLDLHIFHEKLIPLFKSALGLPYIVITPLESDPLCVSWANLLQDVDKTFFISQFGADEARKAGVSAEHIEIGIDTNSWRLRTEEEYKRARKSIGIEDDEFVILTVADNQERKNLSRGMEIVANLKKIHGIKLRHILVTREKSQVGWKLYDLAYELGISSELMVFNNGMPFSALYSIYCTADAFLLCSLGEGLGLPVMEAMSVGVPVVANRTGAIPELLGKDRGWVVDWNYWHYNPFGNQKRYFIDTDKAVESLLEIKNNQKVVVERSKNAREFMERRTWERTGAQIEKAIEEVSLDPQRPDERVVVKND